MCSLDATERRGAAVKNPDALEHPVAVERSLASMVRQDAEVWRPAALSLQAGVVWVGVEGALEKRVFLQPWQAAPELHGTQAE